MKAILTACLFSAGLFAQQSRGPLTDQRVMGLVADGVSPQEVIRIINAAPAVDFVLRPDWTDAMMKAGVTEEMIKAMAAREGGVAPAASLAFTPENVRSHPSPGASSPEGAIAPTPVTASSSQPRVVTSSSYEQGGETHKLTYDGGIDS